MAGNTTPIFSRIGVISGSTIGSVQTFSSGSYTVGSNIFPVFIADATNGAYVQRVRFAPISTTAATGRTTSAIAVTAEWDISSETTKVFSNCDRAESEISSGSTPPITTASSAPS